MIWLLGLLKPLGNLIAKILPYLFAWQAGKDSVNKKRLQKENEILKRQRDNDVHSSDDAISLHKKHSK